MATLTEEDRRALDYQARQRRIAANQMANAARLTGNPARRQDLQDAWNPVILARYEARHAGYDDPDCEDIL